MGVSDKLARYDATVMAISLEAYGQMAQDSIAHLKHLLLTTFAVDMNTQADLELCR